MILSKVETNRLKIVVSSADFQIVEKIAENLIDSIHREVAVKDTEWETLKTTMLKEGQVTGIQRFVKELFTNSK